MPPAGFPPAETCSPHHFTFASLWVAVASVASMQVLIIDDEENIRRTTAVVLESMGHKTVGVEKGAAALKQLENDHFDVAFLDLKLSGESGLDLLPELLKTNPQLEVIVFTA